jgi:hypothetical protein
MVTLSVDEVMPATDALPTQPLGDLFEDALVVGGVPALPVLAPGGCISRQRALLRRTGP